MCTLLSIALILATLAILYLGRELRGIRHAIGLRADRLEITADKIGRAGGVANESRPWLARHGGVRATPPSSPGASERGRDS